MDTQASARLVAQSAWLSRARPRHQHRTLLRARDAVTELSLTLGQAS